MGRGGGGGGGRGGGGGGRGGHGGGKAIAGVRASIARAGRHGLKGGAGGRSRLSGRVSRGVNRVRTKMAGAKQGGKRFPIVINGKLHRLNAGEMAHFAKASQHFEAGAKMIERGIGAQVATSHVLARTGRFKNFPRGDINLRRIVQDVMDSIKKLNDALDEEEEDF